MYPRSIYPRTTSTSTQDRVEGLTWSFIPALRHIYNEWMVDDVQVKQQTDFSRAQLECNRRMSVQRNQTLLERQESTRPHQHTPSTVTLLCHVEYQCSIRSSRYSLCAPAQIFGHLSYIYPSILYIILYTGGPITCRDAIIVTHTLYGACSNLFIALSSTPLPAVTS